jgi:hypothetical protein
MLIFLVPLDIFLSKLYSNKNIFEIGYQSMIAYSCVLDPNKADLDPHQQIVSPRPIFTTQAHANLTLICKLPGNETKNGQ